jgi:hypothetical protein
LPLGGPKSWAIDSFQGIVVAGSRAHPASPIVRLSVRVQQVGLAGAVPCLADQESYRKIGLK